MDRISTNLNENKKEAKQTVEKGKKLLFKPTAHIVADRK